jgi:AraC-like DNA-binding protein
MFSRKSVFQQTGNRRRKSMKISPDLVFLGQPNGAPKRAQRSHWRLSAEESNYSPLRMAEQCHVSLRHLERRFKLEVGFTPRVWLKRQRLKTALVRLQSTASIKEIAYGLRYCQVSHFCRDFKLQFRMTPSEFRRLPRPARERLLAVDAPTRTDPSSRESLSALAVQVRTTQLVSR